MQMNVRNEERGKVEKDLKILKQLQATEEKALALLEQGKPVNLLSVADLDILDGDPLPAYERWTDEEEQRLVALNAINIDISDTQYEREVALKKRELEAAADHFNREERDKL
jgi:hypothetical protein